MEKSLEDSYKIKYSSMFYQTITLLGLYPRETKTCLHKNLCTIVHGSFIFNCPKLEIVHMFYNRLIVNETKVQSNHSKEKEQAIDTYNNLLECPGRKKLICKVYILHKSINTIFWDNKIAKVENRFVVVRDQGSQMKIRE